MYFNNNFKNKKILVLGHTGFKGSWLVAWLKKLGGDLAGFSIDVPTSPSHFELANMSQDLKEYRGNVENIEELSSCVHDFQPEVIFHLAANAIVSDCIENPINAFKTNLLGTVNVLEVIRTSSSVKAAVIVTSDKCYENVEWNYGYRESDQLGGKDPYSASKACAEIAFSSYYRTYLQSLSRVKIATARAGNVIGGGDWAKDRIVPDCIKAWVENKSVKIRSPHSTRPWQLVLEPLSGYLHLASELIEKNENASGESYNFGPPSDVNKSVQLLIEEMMLLWKGKKLDIETGHKIQTKEASLLKLCCDKALADLAWRPVLSFNETVEMTSSWYLNWNNKNIDIKEFTYSQIARYEQLATQRGLVWTK